MNRLLLLTVLMVPLRAQVMTKIMLEGGAIAWGEIRSVTEESLLVTSNSRKYMEIAKADVTSVFAGAVDLTSVYLGDTRAANYYISQNKTRSIGFPDISISLRDVGITMIAASGMFGYINNNMECDPCNTLEEFDDFVDEYDSRAKRQYISLAVGAILMLIDSEGERTIVAPRRKPDAE